MADRPTRYPMPPHLRDDTERAIQGIADVDTRYEIRRLVARAYALGFDDGDINGHITGHNDDRAEHDANKNGDPTQ